MMHCWYIINLPFNYYFLKKSSILVGKVGF